MDVETELVRLWNSPKYEPQTTELMGAKIELIDGPSFVSQYRQIVIGESYSFNSVIKDPIIIDGGANIGVACLWWKWKWPSARIVAIEADPRIFSTLSRNLRFHSEIELCNLALSNKETKQLFKLEGSDGGHLFFSGSTENTIEVNSIRLSSLLKKYDHVDLLKLDIEGSELLVIQEAQKYLHKVENIFIEYHSCVNSKQELSKLIEILERNKFRYYIEGETKKNKPLEYKEFVSEFDLQLDIWAWKTS